MKIYHRTTGQVIFESSSSTIKDTFEEYIFSYKTMYGADLRGMNLQGANLKTTPGAGRVVDIDFEGADLRNADFSRCKIIGCNFKDARLDGAIFSGTVLRYNNFNAANFSAADTGEWNIDSSNVMYDTIGISNQFEALPTGEFYFYKTLRSWSENKKVAVLFKVPENAGRMRGVNGRCWAERVQVVECQGVLPLNLGEPRVQTSATVDPIRACSISIMQGDEIVNPLGFSTDERRPLGVYFDFEDIANV